MNISFTIITIAVVLVLGWFIANYNKFIKYITRAKEAWSDIDIQLKRRYDLIPNLVNIVKGYATHEAHTLEAVITARNLAVNAVEDHVSMGERAQKEDALSHTLKSIFALSENYPDLKANTNFLSLQQELADTENKIQAARRFYNTNVRDLNIAVDAFPSNIIARIFKFTHMEFFDLGESKTVAQEPVQVKF